MSCLLVFAEIIEFVCFYFVLIVDLYSFDGMHEEIWICSHHSLGYLEVLLPYIFIENDYEGDGIIIIQTGLSLIVIILTVMSIS